MRPLLQPGNSVRAVWRARLDEHLGPMRSRARSCAPELLLASSHAVYGVTHLASLARLLPERDPHEDIYEMLEHTLDDFEDAGEAAVHLVRFELAMLAELGFGLDLDNCAATGETEELAYVSPKSGGAVSRTAGEPWRDRLLRLPAFLRAGEGSVIASPTRICRTVSGSPACFCCATCWSRAGRAIPTPREGLSTR
jgi:DNA repair protein RecO (recombination protein O)